MCARLHVHVLQGLQRYVRYAAVSPEGPAPIITTSRVNSFVVSFLAVMVKPFRSKNHKTNCVRFSVSQNTEITNLGAFMKRKISDGMFYNCSQTGRQYTPKAKK